VLSNSGLNVVQPYAHAASLTANTRATRTIIWECMSLEPHGSQGCKPRKTSAAWLDMACGQMHRKRDDITNEFWSQLRCMSLHLPSARTIVGTILDCLSQCVRCAVPDLILRLLQKKKNPPRNAEQLMVLSSIDFPTSILYFQILAFPEFLLHKSIPYT
jgi:hypothetical protein